MSNGTSAHIDYEHWNKCGIKMEHLFLHENVSGTLAPF